MPLSETELKAIGLLRTAVAELRLVVEEEEDAALLGVIKMLQQIILKIEMPLRQ
jgi:hypothetical protein